MCSSNRDEAALQSEWCAVYCIVSFSSTRRQRDYRPPAWRGHCTCISWLIISISDMDVFMYAHWHCISPVSRLGKTTDMHTLPTQAKRTACRQRMRTCVGLGVAQRLARGRCMETHFEWFCSAVSGGKPWVSPYITTIIRQGLKQTNSIFTSQILTWQATSSV